MKPAGVEKDTHIIQSLDKGLYLLEVVEQAGKPITLGELWEKIHWDKATIHRLLVTLERRGYLLRNKKTKQYSLGFRIYGLYNSLKGNMDIQEITRPFIAELAEVTGESAHLAVVEGKSLVFIDRVSSSEVLSVNTQIGAREPLYCTALGRAYLSFLHDVDLGTMYPEPLKPVTSRTVVDLEELAKVLERIRRLGYAFDDEEYTEGIRCLAAPVLNELEFPIAMVGISGPKNRLPKNKVLEYGEVLRSIALKISIQCGYQEKKETS